jgi:hypothetical protein
MERLPKGGGSMESEFKFMGLSIPLLTITYGLFLVVWGASVSLATQSQSITSWIPSMLGCPILLGGIMSKAKPGQRTFWTHLAVIFGLFCFLGGLDFFRGFSSEGGPFGKPAAGASKLMLFGTGGVYIYGCIRSFIAASKANSTS